MTLPVHPSVSSGRASLISVPRPSHRLSRGSRLALTIVIALCTAVLADRPAAQPTPGPRQILVRVRAVSLNQRDLSVSRGTYGGTGGGSMAGKVPLSDGA